MQLVDPLVLYLGWLAGVWRGVLGAALVVGVLTPSHALAQEPAREPGLTLVQALRLALVHDPEIHLAENQVAASRGGVLSAQGTFDPQLTSSLDGGESRIPLAGGSSASSESFETRLDWSQTLRSGQTLQPQLTLDRSTTASGTVNTATVSFTLRQPLLRGRNREAVTAFEGSARHDLEAARLDLAHTTALRLLTVATQYWTVKAAVLNLEVLRSTEESSRSMLETTKQLIAAQLTPAAELVQLEADLVLRQANRIVGESNLFLAVQLLGEELGLTAEQIAALKLPSDAFPTIDSAQIPDDAGIYRIIARERRADLLAAEERLRADSRRLVAADDTLKPRFDLVFTPSYSGRTEGAASDDYFSSLWTDVPGLSTSLTFELSLPIRNQTARGDRLRAQSSVQRRELLIARSRKEIDSRVPAALEAVRRNTAVLESLEQAVKLFERSLENEVIKLRSGNSTLIDVISQRDRLTSIRQGRNAAQLDLAVSLLELRFEVGMLIELDAGSSALANLEDFTTLPTLEAESR